MTLTSGDRITNTGGSPDNLKAGSDKYNAHKHERLYNYVFNSDAEIWGSGTTSAPTGWTLTGAGATIAKNTTAGQFKVGAASAAVTRVGTDCYLGQTVDTISGQGPVGWWQSKEVTLGCWVRATVASRARIAIYDGVGTTYSSYHTGGSSLEFLTVTRTLDAAATEVTVRLYVDTGNTTAQFDGAILVIGPDVDDWQPSGWRGQRYSVDLMSSGAGIAAGSTRYLHSMGEATGQNLSSRVTRACVMRRLYVRSNAAPGAGETYVFTLMVDQVAGAVTCTINNPDVEANDATNENAFAVGEQYNVRVVTSGAAASADFSATLEVEEVP